MKRDWPGIYRGAPQPEWMFAVRIGDVLQAATGTYRVVRDLSRYASGELYHVTFVIAHPSWTGRATTVLNASDLRTRGFRHAGVRLKLDTVTDLMIDAAIAQEHRPHRGERFVLTASEVRGIA